MVNHYRWDFVGLSTDDKPTPQTSEKVADGSTFYEGDTSKLYIWYDDQWYEKVVSGGGGGGGDYDHSDPEQVYEHERPDDWLKMPEIGETDDNIIYMLLQRSSDSTLPLQFEFTVNRDGTDGTSYIDFGTVQNGVFVPNEPLSLESTNRYWTEQISIPVSAFSDETSDGNKQIIMRISTGTEGTNENITTCYTYYNLPYGLMGSLVELKGKATKVTAILRDKSNTQSYATGFSQLQYFSLIGSNELSNLTYLFNNDKALKAVLSLDMSKATKTEYMFQNCFKLVALPTLDLATATSVKYMFQNCYSLEKIAEIKHTDKVTNFSNMMSNCYNLREFPSIDTSAGTTTESMFAGCNNLTSALTFDLTSATTVNSMFSGCNSFSSLPILQHTSNVTNFAYLFVFTSIRYHYGKPLDFRIYDFSTATNMGYLFFGANIGGATCAYLPDKNKLPASGIPSNCGLVINSQNSSEPVKYIITDETDMIPLQTTATSIFGSGSGYANTFVYVPDTLLTTYQADSNWSSLNTRLKPLSELNS